MKKLILSLMMLLGAAHLFGQAETLDFGAHGKITLYLLGDWKFNTSDFGDRQLININPTGDTNATCTLTITFPDQDRYDTKARLKQRVEVNGMPYAEQSVEGKSVAKEFNVKTGYGFYCNFTDPELVGKAPQKGNFKTITAGMIRVAPDVLFEVSISADGFSSDPYQQLLGMLEGMEFSGGRGAKR